MPTHLVNLDALLIREDFEAQDDSSPQQSNIGTNLKVGELESSSVIYHMLRKPDFQRETANWEPEKVAEFIQSFLEGDLIPALIMWRSSISGNLFVIDGAHRLSALLGSIPFK